MLVSVPVTAVLLALAGAAPARGDGWARPVPGPVVARFSYDASQPFRPGARRNLWLAARPGEPVRAACGGRVVFAGRLPGGGSAVSLRCGSRHVTHLGVAQPSGARRVAAGDPIGTAAGHAVGVGVRPAARRRAYVDPEALLPGPSPPAGPAGAPVRRRPPRSVALDRRSPPPMPWPAWVGLAAVAVGCSPSGLRRLREARVGRRAPSPRVLARSP